MKTAYIAVLALVAGTSGALAADLAPHTYKAAPLASPAFNWSGFYLGAHGGFAWGKTIDTTNSGADQRKPDGGFGGIQAGYNWQPINSPWVFGLETDISFGSIKENWGGANQFDPYYGSDGLGTFGTFRGRLGYAIDNWMIYATGGLAYGENKHAFGCDANRVALTLGCQNKVGGQAFYATNNEWRVGYVVGAGIEYAVTRNWSIKGEYTYTDYGTETINMTDPNYPAAKSARNFDGKYQNVRVGVNYHF